MKTASLPSIRVEPELRDELEKVLQDGETVSAFIESSVRQVMRKRQLDAEFHARAVAASERFKAGETAGYTTEQVMDRLHAKLEKAKVELAKRKAPTKVTP